MILVAGLTMMQSESYLHRLRSSRDSRSVMKMKLVMLRGKSPSRAILVFEGDDDKIVYGRWLPRLCPNIEYEVMVCKGKGGVCQTQKIVADDKGSLSGGIYLFIDRDYDDDRGFDAHPSLFMTEYYSVDNYLVSEQVLLGILRDEFPCHEHPELRKRVLDQFNADYDDFLSATCELNRLLFIAQSSTWRFRSLCL